MTTVTWTNLQGAVDSGSGTITSNNTIYNIHGGTNQGFSADGGFFEGVLDGTRVCFGIYTGSFPTGTGNSATDTTLAAGFSTTPGGLDLYKNGVYQFSLFNPNPPVVAGTVVRLQRQGTNLLFRFNGVTYGVLPNFFSGATYYGYWKAQNDAGPYSLSSAVIQTDTEAAAANTHVGRQYLAPGVFGAMSISERSNRRYNLSGIVINDTPAAPASITPTTVTWTSLTNATDDGDGTLTSHTDSGVNYYLQAATTQQISGAGFCYFEVKLPATGSIQGAILGIINGALPAASAIHTAYGLHLTVSGALVNLYNGSTWINDSTGRPAPTNGDTIRLQIFENGNVHAALNGVVFATIIKPTITYPLYGAVGSSNDGPQNFTASKIFGPGVGSSGGSPTVYTLTIDFASINLTPKAVTLAAARQLNVDQASLAFTAEPVSVLAARKLTVASASLALTAQPVRPLVSRVLNVASSSLTLTARSITLAKAYSLSVASASLTLTPKPVTLAKTYALPVAAASLNLTARSVSMIATRVLNVGQGSITLTPGSIGIGKAYSLQVATASVSLTAKPVTLLAQRRLAVATASIGFTPKNVSLIAARTLSVANSSLSFTARPVSVLATRTLSIASASLTLSSKLVTLLAQRKLSVAPATLALTAEPVTLAAQRRLNVAPASISFSGQGVILRPIRAFVVDSASLGFTARPVSLLAQRQLNVDHVTLTFLPYAVTIVQNGSGKFYFIVDTAFLSLTPQDTKLQAQRKLNVAPASLALTPEPVTLATQRVLKVASAPLNLTAGAVKLLAARKLSVATASLAFSAGNVSLPLHRVISVASSSIALTPKGVGLIATRRLNVASSSLALTASPVILARGFNLHVDMASITTSPGTVNLVASRVLSVASSSLLLTGVPVAIVFVPSGRIMQPVIVTATFKTGPSRSATFKSGPNATISVVQTHAPVTIHADFVSLIDPR